MREAVFDVLHRCDHVVRLMLWFGVDAGGVEGHPHFSTRNWRRRREIIIKCRKPGANVRASRRARAFENATTAPLPKGWKEHRDEDGVYYLEMKTGRTTTERPAA